MADIPISAVHRRVQYTSSGSVGPYSFSFAILAEGDLAVYNGTALKSLSTHYTVSLNTNGTGTITFTGGNAPANGAIVTIESNQAIARTTDFSTGGDFKAATINSELDQITVSLQQLETALRRGIQIDSFANRDVSASGAGPLILTYADTASTQANAPVQFNSSGTGLEAGTSLAFPAALSGNGTNMLRVNSGATAYEFQTPAQVFTNLLATESNGMIAHAGSGAAEPRTITGTSNQITLTNGDGVSGNPVVSIPDAVTLSGKTITGGTFSAMASGTTLASMGSANLSVASKQYVDSALAGIRTRLTVKAATTANITIATALNNGDTLDGISLSDGDTVLVKDQSDQSENGLYTVASSPARSSEADTWDEIAGQLISIQQGSANADDLYLNTSDSGGTLNTTAITYTKVFPGTGGTVTSVSTAGLASGGEITGSGTVTVAINSQSALSASPAAADQFAIYDADATAHKKITTTELFGAADLTATAREYTKTQNFNMTTLSDGSSISWDLSQNQVATVTLAGNRTLAAPSNQVAGATYILIVVQDGTGSRTLDTSNAAYIWPGGTEPTLSTTAAAIDVLTFVSNGTKMLGVAQLGFA